MSSEPSMRYYIRVIRVLEDHQAIGISDLAAKTRMHHSRCSGIVKFMEQEGYLLVSFDRGRKTIKVTEKGMLQIKKLLTSMPPSTTV